jgi:hypothetical protein
MATDSILKGVFVIRQRGAIASASRFSLIREEEAKGWLIALSVCYFILAVLNVAGGVFWLAFFPSFFVMIDMGGAPGTPPPSAELGNVCIGMGICGLVISWVGSYMLFRAGMSLLQHKRWTFCFVIAILLCNTPPVGTILGIFTIIVLTCPLAKKLFEHGDRAVRQYEDA